MGRGGEGGVGMCACACVCVCACVQTGDEVEQLEKQLEIQSSIIEASKVSFSLLLLFSAVFFLL